jgi:MinD superfamily P-loop ATPase
MSPLLPDIERDPCARCGCGVACHWDDFTTEAPNPLWTSEPCQRCPKCPGYQAPVEARS